MPFPAKLAFIHPIWFLALALVAFVAPVFVMNAGVWAMVALALATVWLLLLPLGWAHGIYKGARIALAKHSAVGPSHDWVFYVAGIGIVCVPILGWGVFVAGVGVNGGEALGLLIVPLVGSYLVSLWLASTALVASEEGTLKIAAPKAVVTFLLMFYWVIGAWVMQRRLKALRQAVETAAPKPV